VRIDAWHAASPCIGPVAIGPTTRAAKSILDVPTAFLSRLSSSASAGQIAASNKKRSHQSRLLLQAPVSYPIKQTQPICTPPTLWLWCSNGS
jgi:hypothetical protein